MHHQAVTQPVEMESLLEVKVAMTGVSTTVTAATALAVSRQDGAAVVSRQFVLACAVMA